MTRSLSAIESYVYSYTPSHDWSFEKQWACWYLVAEGGDANSPEVNVYNDDGTLREKESNARKKVSDGALAIIDEAKKYKDYYNKIKESENGLDPKNLTNVKDITTKVDRKNGLYTIGKFNLSYINGIYTGITFGGISEMYAIGYNKNGGVVNGNIKIEKIILSKTNEEITLSYKKDGSIEGFFTPETEDKQYVDKNEQKYPMSNEEFEIVIKNPNEGVEVNDPNRITSISLKVKFKYMMAYGKAATFEGYLYEIDYLEVKGEGKHNHLTCGHNCSTSASCGPARVFNEKTGNYEYTHHCSHTHDDVLCYTKYDIMNYYLKGTDPYAKPSGYDACKKHQQNTISVDAIRVLYEQELIIRTDDGDDDDDGGGDDGGNGITIDIEGKVWEDMRDGKESSINGEYDDNDVLVNGVDVILYDDKGNKIDSVKTGNDGRYEFKDLDAMRTYYVEFKYNGQQYQNTKYNDILDGKHSVATDDNRDGFNNKFKELDGSLNGEYTIKELTYDDTRNQYYNSNDLFRISAFTGTNGKSGLVKYPKPEQFVISKTTTTIGNFTYTAVYANTDTIKNIDFGITQRIEFDMALKKDLYIATVKINGKTEVYGYDGKNLGNNHGEAETKWNITVVGGYERSLDDADWKFDGKKNENTKGLLEVYATYKIVVRNELGSMVGQVTKLYDYYDDTFEFMPELSWQMDDNLDKSKETLEALQNAMANNNLSDFGERPKAEDDHAGTVTVNVDKKQQTGERQYVYLTFKIKSNGNVILGIKKNKAEIGSFITYYAAGTVLPRYDGKNDFVCGEGIIAGRVDKDSKPSTMGKSGEPGKNDLGDPEDDEDAAPDLNVKTTGDTRKLTGVAWEDERTETVNNAVIGDGKLDGNEKRIAGIKVELVEKTVWDKGNESREVVWAEATTDSEGKYTFSGYIPGDYIIRFTYGEGTSSADLNDGTSYNGQDYKTTTYQAEIDQSGNTDLDGKYNGYTNAYGQNSSGSYGFDIAKLDATVSSAKDLWSYREKVNNYSKESVKNYRAEVLASPYTNYKKDLHDTLVANTTMRAESGVVVIEVERNKQSTEGNGTPSYSIDGLNIGLEERPKAQLEIDKSITNIKITSANGAVLFDVNKKGDNVAWLDHKEYNLASKKKNGTYNYSYTEKERIRRDVIEGKNGLVQISMDEELMHGSTIEITYAIKITNVGEYDYDDKAFYYTGKESGNVVTTTPNQIIDYVSNNLKFDASKNDGWKIINTNELYDTNNPGELDGRLLNIDFKNNVLNFNNIITTEFTDALKPGDSCEKTLVLSQVITSENKEDDLTYRNIVEIVKTSNTVGRRMAYSIVGNQDPTTEAQEVDACVAEQVYILPPFGDTHIYYILGFTVGIILIGGITLILKKVLKK